jgi:hypothetical protein
MPFFHFLLVYDHGKHELVHRERFEDADEAAEAYARMEGEHKGDKNLEIVLVGADSIETIRKTHGNYFDGSSPLDPFPTRVRAHTH